MTRIAVLALFVAAASAPSAQTKDPVTLTLRLAGEQRQFRPGETIGIELTFESPISGRFLVDSATYDRSGRLTIDEFRLAPLALVTDPMLDYFAQAGAFIGGGIRGMGQLGEGPHTVRLELNDWFRFDTPGTFSLSVRSSRVSDETLRKPGSLPTLPVESNAVTFEVLPRDPGWERAELERAVEILKQTRGPGRRSGCSILRFLGTPAAVDEMIRRWDDEDCQFDFMAGMFSAPDRAYVVRRLEEGLPSRNPPLNQNYVRTLSVLSVYLKQPELRPAQNDASKGRMLFDGELRRRPELVRAEADRYTAMAARNPVASLTSLPEARQRTILEFEWPSIASLDLLPVLRRLASGTSSLADLALRRLYQLAPEEGRSRILEVIRRPHAGSTLRTLGVLPDPTIPSLDDELARSIEPPVGNLERVFPIPTMNMALIQRYASPALAPKLLPRVSALIGRMVCEAQEYAIAYFLRVSPRDGAALLDKALTSRSTGCYTSALPAAGRLWMTPEVEKAAVAALDDEHPRVVLGAIDTLGKFGSSSAQPILLARFDGWQREWRPRAEELRPTPLVGPETPASVNRLIETAYLNALSTAQGWLTTADQVA